jgi:hypothetical protein
MKKKRELTGGSRLHGTNYQEKMESKKEEAAIYSKISLRVAPSMEENFLLQHSKRYGESKVVWL